MNYRFLVYCFLFIIGAIDYYKLNKWSLEGRDGNKNPDLYSKPQTNLQNFNSWVIIIGFVIGAIICLFKSIN